MTDDADRAPDESTGDESAPDEAAPDGSAPDGVRNAGYDDWLDRLGAGDGYYLESPGGHGSLPPRRVCPETGSTDLSEASLPETGRLETFTVVHVPPPRFADDAPYVTAVADFGPVRLTGVLRGVDPEDDAIDIGLEVTVDVERRETDDGRVVTFRPR